MNGNTDPSVDLFSFIHDTANNDNLFEGMGYSNQPQDDHHQALIGADAINNDIYTNPKEEMYDFSQQVAFSHQNGANSDFGPAGLSRGSMGSLSPSTNTSSISPNSDKSTNVIEQTQEDAASKKKAQNRAAQRAFRERKEAKLATLEAKLKESESHKENLQKEVDELRKLNQEIHAENRTLLQRQDMEYREQTQNNVKMEPGENVENHEFIAPRRERFYEELMQEVQQKSSTYNEAVVNKTYQDNGGNTILTVPATWEYLQSVDDGDLDIIEVVQKLKGNEVCHGSGPAYPKHLIDAAIRQVQSEM